MLALFTIHRLRFREVFCVIVDGKRMLTILGPGIVSFTEKFPVLVLRFPATSRIYVVKIFVPF